MSTTENKKPIFENPYVSYDGPKEYHTFLVSRADLNTLKSCRLMSGTLTGVTGYLIQKLCYELRQRGITHFDQSDEFEQFVSTCHIVSDGEFRRLHDGAAGGTLQQTSPPNDGTGMAGLRDSAAPVKAKQSDVQGRSRSKRTGKTEGK